MRADRIRLRRAPGVLVAHRTGVARADAVAPVVAGDEVPTRVAQVGRGQPAHGLQDVQPKALRVGQRGARVVEAVVDTAAQVLDEAPEQPGVDRRDDGRRVNGNRGGHTAPSSFSVAVDGRHGQA